MSILGPINPGDPFLLVYLDSTNQPYVLNLVNPGSVYFWDPDLATAIQNPALPVFTGAVRAGGANFFTITDAINGNGINFPNNNGVVTNGIQSAVVVTQTNTDFTGLASPSIFLGNVPYTFSTSNQTVAQITLGSTTIPASNIILLPIVWYADCQGGSYFLSNSISDSLGNWACTVAPTSPFCANQVIQTEGWTLLSDCQSGLRYDYCTTGNLCGTGGAPGCNGVCSQIYYDCITSGQDLICQFNSEQYIEDPATWRSPLFIGAVVGIIIVALILGFLIIWLLNRNDKNSTTFENESRPAPTVSSG